MLRSVKLDNQQISAATRLFSPTVFRELARYGRSVEFGRLIRELSSLRPISDHIERNSPIRELFDSAFELLKLKNHRHEFIYKSALVHKVLLGRHSLSTAVLLNEFRVGECIADFAIINDTSNVYEIKTERDSLRRLRKQISAYQNIFARVNLIVGENHLESVLSSTSCSVGVLMLNRRYQISTVRESKEFLDNINSETIFDSIRLSESKEILGNLGVEFPHVPNTRTYSTLKSIFSNLPKIQVHEQMTSVLRKHRNQTKLSDFLHSLPKPMVTIALCTPIRKCDRIQLLNALETPLPQTLDWC